MSVPDLAAMVARVVECGGSVVTDLPMAYRRKLDRGE
jgi:hypothetical protein